MLSATQQTQEEVERTKLQLSFEVDRIKQEADIKVGGVLFCLEDVPSLYVCDWWCFIVTVAGGAEVWDGEAEERAGGEDGRSGAHEGDSEEQRDGEWSPVDL